MREKKQHGTYTCYTSNQTAVWIKEISTVVTY